MGNHAIWPLSQAGRLDELAQLPEDIFDRATLERALCVAVANDHAEIVRFLLRAAVKADARIMRYDPRVCLDGLYNSANALHTAARHDSADALRALVEAKAGVNEVTGTWSAVVTAAEHGATACVGVLVSAKADLTATKDDLTPVCAAAKSGDIGMLHLLLQHKASVDRWRPITLAAHHGHTGAVHVLLLAKADIEAGRSRACTPLNAAAGRGHVNVMLLLLQAKADAMHCSQIWGWSALSFAASAGHTAAVRCLLQHAPALAAVVSCQEYRYIPAGSTPLDIARFRQRKNVKHAATISLLVAATSSQ